VSLDCVIYCAFYSILFRGQFFLDTVYIGVRRPLVVIIKLPSSNCQ